MWVTLFERDHRTVALTAEGAALLPRARQIIEQWEVAQRAIADVVTARRTALTIGFHTRIGRGLIPDVTARMATVLFCRPVRGLSPSELAVVWRTKDDRPAVRTVVETCTRCLCDDPDTAG